MSDDPIPGGPLLRRSPTGGSAIRDPSRDRQNYLYIILLILLHIIHGSEGLSVKQNHRWEHPPLCWL